MITEMIISQQLKTVPIIGYTDIIVKKRIGESKFDIYQKGYYNKTFIFEDAIKLDTWELPRVNNR